MITYGKLWLLLAEKGMKRTDLCKDPVKLAPGTLAKMGKNEYISLEVIDRICKSFDVQPGDILEYIDLDKTKVQLDNAVKKINESIDQIAELSNTDVDTVKNQLKFLLGDTASPILENEINWDNLLNPNPSSEN